MRRSTFLTFAAALLGTAAMAISPASAIPIVAGSQIDFVGGVTPIGGTDVYNATGVDFRTAGLNSPGVPGSISLTNTTNGSFSIFTALTCLNAVLGGCGTIVDLTSFGPGANSLNAPPLPVLNFLTVTQGAAHTSFDLLNFTFNKVQPSSNGLGQLILQGLGTLHLAGFDDTAGIMTITAQGPQSTSFSGTVVAQPTVVPEPASMLVLGAGLIGFGAVSRKRRTLV
jgi:uncharacterized protein YceK